MKIGSSRLRRLVPPDVTVGEFIAALSRFPMDSVVEFRHDSPSVKTPDGKWHYDIGLPDPGDLAWDSSKTGGE